MLRNVVTVEEVINSPLVADPLHRLDCCLVSDGGGALLVVAPEIAAQLKRPAVRVLGAGEAIKHLRGGEVGLTHSAGLWSAAKAFEEAGVRPADIQYASLHDIFIISVPILLERRHPLAAGIRCGHGVFVERRATRHAPLRHCVCDTGRRSHAANSDR